MPFNTETSVSNMELGKRKRKHWQIVKDVLCSMKRALYGAFLAASHELLAYTQEKELP